MGHRLDLYIATKLSVQIFFSFLYSCSSRPLETLKLWFLPSRPLWGGSQKKNSKTYIYIHIHIFGDPPLGPQETSFDILKSPDPLDYSLDWHYGTGRTYPIECVGSSCPALSNYLVCLVRVYFNFQRALMKVYVAKNVPLIILIIMPLDRPLHDTQQEQI